MRSIKDNAYPSDLTQVVGVTSLNTGDCNPCKGAEILGHDPKYGTYPTEWEFDKIKTLSLQALSYRR
ncbi:hypothetical protein [Paenibacillus lentus]|uniref:Uncharacterized protein n=1 Tax=Paenibacillus lentus TaxID=1338368 RepID=A0A3Q8S5M9_9BACL|nr:hypothetical protein [Paenibacillus lentus]AZK47538.1 hypothetical protein EIM92_16425 [Paenibacillus lentus]